MPRRVQECAVRCKYCGYDIADATEACPRCSGEAHRSVGRPLAPLLRGGDVLAERFVLERRLGAGGLGEVWLAHDSVLDGAAVACKLLREDYFHDRRAIADLKREVLLARRLRHPNILGVHTFWETTAHRFVVMEYVEGHNLAEALRVHGRPFTLAQVLPWLQQLCDALDYAHGEGVLHRDIKPANFLQGTNGNVQLADFGIARTLKEMALAGAGEITCGTLLFMSPEQLNGQQLDLRSDLYSLAASTYELLAGAPPFYEGAIIERIRRAAPPLIAHLGPAVNAALAAGLAKDRDVRPARCGAFLAALAQAAAREGESNSMPQGLPGPGVRDKETVQMPVAASGGDDGRLGSLLLKAGVITHGQLETACARQENTSSRLGEVLDSLGYANEGDVARVLAQQLRLPYHEHLDDADMDFRVAHLVSAGVARQSGCLPLRWSNGHLVVAMADPFDLNTINALEASVRARVDTVVVPPSVVAAAVERVFSLQA